MFSLTTPGGDVAAELRNTGGRMIENVSQTLNVCFSTRIDDLMLLRLLDLGSGISSNAGKYTIH